MVNMFDNLGKSLSNLIKRLVTSVSIDKAAVEEILKDLKVTLLQADVDISLTEELIKNIRKKCLEEKIPAGLTLREHVLKTIYEELVRLLGEKPAGLIGKKKIMFVGLFGSGKCIHKDSFVPLANGEILKISELYDLYKNKEKEEKVEDGYKIELKQNKIEVFSFNPESLKIEKREVSTLWKLKPNKELIKISLDNGKMHEIIVTPEHPFYVIENGGIKEIEAENLKEGSRIAVPNYLPIDNKKLVDIRKEILNNLSDDFVIFDKKIKDKVKELLSEKYGSLKKSYSVIKPSFSYSRFTYMLKHGIIPLSVLRKARPDLIYQIKNLKIKYHLYRESGKKYVKIPSFLDPNLAEFLGYLLSEGNVDEISIHITNTSNILIKRIKKLARLLFGLEASVICDKRRSNVKRIDIPSKTLIKFLEEIFKINSYKKSSNVTIPKLILTSPNKVLNRFLRAYFDGEGSIEGRYIEIPSASKEIIWQIGLVLLRNRILSTYSKKKVNGKTYYRLFIHGIHAENFGKYISSNLPDKKIHFKKAEIIGRHQSPGKLEVIPVGPLLSQVREAFGISIGEMQNFVNSYGTIENSGNITRTSLSNYLNGINIITKERPNWIGILKMARNTTNYQELLGMYKNRGWLNATLNRLLQLGWIKKFNKGFLLTEKGKEMLEKISNFDLEDLEFLYLLSKADVSWIKVKKVTKVKARSQYVYDLTVNDLHNFVANGIIVHNTTSIAKLARYFQKQGLRPALVALDYHRPAAPEQLKQLGDQIKVPVHIQPNKNPYDAAIEGMKKFEKYDVIIFDTAGRNALDKELADELKKLGEIIKPDEVILTIPADLGKVAKKQSEEFNKLVGITGIFITKMDGTAKAGGALAACSATKAKVKFIGTGEHIEDFEVYDPERFVSRLLGLGDLQTLLEKAKEAEIKPEKVEKIVEGKFTLQDFMEQIEAMQKMGPLGKIAQMIPGLGMKLPEDLMEKQEEKMKHYKHIIQSMTKEERENPEIINASRIKRIAKGSGRPEAEVRELLQQYEQMKKLMKMLGGKAGLERGALGKMMKQFGLKI